MTETQNATVLALITALRDEAEQAPVTDALVGAALRPETLREGDVFLLAIEELMNEFDSGDGCSPGYWEPILDDKRQDDQYGDVVDSISEHGFVRPLTMRLGSSCPDECCAHMRDKISFGDGHHRLAAAIDLGYTHVPVEVRRAGTGIISRDSGSWTREKPVPASNSEIAGWG